VGVRNWERGIDKEREREIKIWVRERETVTDRETVRDKVRVRVW
jgi:hypothetical protein